MNSNNYSYEVSLGRVPRVNLINKFGYNDDIDIASEEVIASFGGAFDPLVNVISTAQTFTIAYNIATDGLGTTGATSLNITYLDENYIEQSAVHVLGNTGSDVTSFSGFGINRAFVLSNGGVGHNVNNITITATTDTTTQAVIPALNSVTQQCIYHTPISRKLLIDYIFVNALKISGGGGSPRINVKGYSFSRVINTDFRVFDIDIDTSVENSLNLGLKHPFVIGGREVFYLTASTDLNNTKVNARFSGVLQDV